MMTMHEFVERVYGEPLSPQTEKLLEMFSKQPSYVNFVKDHGKTDAKRRMKECELNSQE